jgi:hypothetical protein
VNKPVATEEFHQIFFGRNGNFEPVQELTFQPKICVISVLANEGDYVNVGQTLIVRSDVVNVNAQTASIYDNAKQTIQV